MPSCTCASCIFKTSISIVHGFVHFTLCIFLAYQHSTFLPGRAYTFYFLFKSPFPWQRYQNSVAAIVLHYDRDWHDIPGFIQSTQNLNWIYFILLNTDFFFLQIHDNILETFTSTVENNETFPFSCLCVWIKQLCSRQAAVSKIKLGLSYFTIG